MSRSLRAEWSSLHVPAAYETFLKYANLTYTLTKALIDEDYKTYVESLINAAKDEPGSGEETKSENFNMNWAKSLFELSDSFEELEQIVRDRPTYYKEVFDFCAADSNYRIFFEYNNGTIEEVSDISDKLS